MKDKKFIKEIITILIIGAIINGFCFFVCSITGHCANDDLPDGTLPYNVHNYHNINTFTSQEVINYILSDSEVASAIGDNNFIIFPYDFSYSGNSSYFTVEYQIIVNPEVRANFDSNYNYINNGVWVYGSTILCQYSIRSDGSFYNFLYRGYNSSISSYKSLGAVNTATCSFNGKTVTVGYPLALREDIYSPNNFLTFTNATNEIDIGEFTDLPNLDEILNNISNTWESPSSITGHALPSSPTENPNNNDFQNRLQMFQYLGDIITQNFGNLGYNLAKWFNGLQQKLTDGFNSVSQNIWNGFKTLMNNIKDFFGSKLDFIIDKFNYITEDLDPEEVQSFFESTTAYTDISSIQTSVSTFVTSFTGVSEPNDYVITFHIEDISILNQSNPYYLHLNILNPVKSYIRAFLWVVVSYGIFISVIDSLPNYINGGGGEDD